MSRRASRRRCVRHVFGDIEHREERLGASVTAHLFRAECSCGWSTPWWGSVIALVGDTHAHRHARRRGSTVGAGGCA